MQLVRVLALFLVGFFLNTPAPANAQQPSAKQSRAALVEGVPVHLMLQIVRAEDERRWDADLSSLLSHENPSVRLRAAMAAGRIGDDRAVPALVSLLREDKDDSVRAMAAFALGETEAAIAGDALVLEIAKRESPINARVIEAVGKIAAALPTSDEARLQSLRKAILSALEFEANRRSTPNTEVILLGLTAALRARPDGAGKVIAEFLTYGDSRIRADAANALARLRAADGNEQLRKLLTNDADPIVRANAARVLGATEDKTAFDGLLDRAMKDIDLRVRVSAIRALAAVKDSRAANPLLTRAKSWTPKSFQTEPGAANQALEIATTLGRVMQGNENEDAFEWLREARDGFNGTAPEIEIAFARISPGAYLSNTGAAITGKKAQEALTLNWKSGSSLAQGLGAIAGLPDSTFNKTNLAGQAQEILRAMLDFKNSGINIKRSAAVHPEYAIPDVLRALAAFKPRDLQEVLFSHLKETDVIIRATAAELLGELPPGEAIAKSLISALPTALNDKELNDAALAILDSLAKQKTAEANEAIKAALDSSDHLVRRRAVALLKANGAGDFSARIGAVQTRNTRADYERAIARIGRSVHAIVTTTRGSFTIELLPGDAPLNVDNFIQLSKSGYFRGIAVHRVVPNFVIQDGDPRGDGNGGPGYSIRCEINQVPYERGAVGMALSGKDTGGSQWFVTHSPQPHLDGGYTVFGQVRLGLNVRVTGMNVVDQITRGDVIYSIEITESGRRSNH